MTDFGEIPGNVGRIFVDDVDGKRVAACITLRTKHMRNLFTQFPEVLLIDATHGTNRSKYKVFAFMAHDTFGKGQFVQHALLQNERWPTLLTALKEFKANNPSWTKLQCVLIDKDFTEMSVLKQAFPDVTILLCQFHVLKYLREEIASSDYGFNSWQKNQLRGVMSLLVYAKTEMEYARHFDYMQHLASVGYTVPVQTTPSESSAPVDDELASVGHENHPVGHQMGSVGNEMGPVRNEMGPVGQDLSSTSVVGDERRAMHPFVAHFIKNWDNCRELWCAYKRQNTVTLGNNTNNRFEVSRKQLKEWVDSFMAVDECIASTIYYQSLQERRFIDEVYKNVNVQDIGYDHEMSLDANLVSEHACELIYSQYLYALGPAAYDVYEGYPDVYFVKSTRRDDDALDEPEVKYTVT
ncbi:hypothetical protein PR001_g6626 [Phytophthora rubi]|uniref:ZSWIM1/3 RNaseH-like domain-containing protein n=1 Tax=Phytophthora rubi TaxID=129364 RepID=A0A6A3NGU5_9STRA|nr:hypothetical protein PR002_g5065 [Phytophthora rubi]KAE9041418.1 hypothetical protein PR001_g6626 [Phytophthora rubi]